MIVKVFFPILHRTRKFLGKITGQFFLFLRKCGIQSSYGNLPLPLRTNFEIASSDEAEFLSLSPQVEQLPGRTILRDLPCWTNRSEFLNVCRNDSLLNWPSSSLFRLQRSAVYGPDGIIVGQKGSFFPELCRRPGPRPTPQYPLDHPIYNTFFRSGSEVFKGSVAVLSGSSPDVYFHWIFDILPKWRFLQEINAKDPFALVLIGGKPTKFKSEMLLSLGIGPEKIRYLGDEKKILSCETLYAVTETGAGNHFPSSLIQYLRKNFLPCSPSSRNKNLRIFIDRRDAKRRKMICPDYQKLLKKYHFEIIDASQYSVKEQAEIFSKADIIAALHGSALANLVFCEPGTKVIEILPGDYTNVVFWKLASVLKLRYSAIIGKGSCSETGNVFSDFVIDNEDFDKALGEAITNFESN